MMRTKISVEQKHVIIEFMEQNIDFARATGLKVKTGPLYNELWNQLTLILNKTPGPRKDKIKWQKVWSGIKKAIKMKMKKIQIYHDKKTEQCIYYQRLTDLDERIITLMKNKSETNKECDSVSSEDVNNETAETKLNIIKIKSENSQNIMHLQKINESMLMDHVLFSDDENCSESSYEECSNMSWSTNENENQTNTIMLEEKLEAVSLQLEQLIEQNSVTNILLEKIATTLEKTNT